MTSTRTRRAAMTVALAAVLTAGAGTAHADPSYDEAIQLSWDGRTYTSVTAESFLGTPVSVPGDSASRTLLVRNDGPTAGTLRASIVNVELADPDAPDVHHNPEHRSPGEGYGGAGAQGDFYDDLRVRWAGGSASFTELHEQGHTPILEIDLDTGEQVPINLAYELPLAATSGNRANVAPREASFDVLLEIGGTLPSATPTPSQKPAPTPTAPTGPTSDVGAPRTGGGQLQQTGADVGLLVLAAGAALGAGAGLAVLSARRRAARDPGP